MQPRVLLVDDDPHLTAALTRALRREPYDIMAASSAAEALQILARDAIDVLVTDERMPGLTGVELLTIARRHYPETVRVLLTGHASLETALRAINQGGVYQFLTKPCAELEFIRTLRHALQHKGQAQGPVVSPARGRNCIRKALIAEPDPQCRSLLEAYLTRWGYAVVTAQDGAEAWECLQADGSLQLALLDWRMPRLDGLQVCCKVRSQRAASYVYLILLIAWGQREERLRGLKAGADDVLELSDPAELRARVLAGERVVTLEEALAQKVRALEAALAQVKQLQGLLPICMHCKQIRDDRHTWHKLETYIEAHSQALFSHSLCEACLAKYYPETEDDGGEAA